MFVVSNIKENEMDYVVLQNSDKTTNVKISLEEGGRLQDLKINNKTLIKEFPFFNYRNSYASSILFPFASRIEKGKFTYDKNEFQLDCNDSGENALHGLVYNKTFKVLDKVECTNYASVKICYKNNIKRKGFPYFYDMQLTYTLYESEISLSVKIINTDDKTFPFTLGWHPYFFTKDLSKSYLKFESNQKIRFNKHLITEEVVDIKLLKDFKIQDKQLDDCYILNTDTCEFITPNYQLEITTNQTENYLQLYTPKDLPLIAIEPMTGVSNSFNNKIGLQTLAPNQTYSVTWNVKLTK
jgi:aldose 1-epimerase